MERRSRLADVVVRKPADYDEQYRRFVEASDEKQILADRIRTLLVPGRTLDVGAGTGELPELMQLDRANYLAVECVPSAVSTLRQKGYTAIEDVFPCDVPGLFDNVLMCYCLYGGRQQINSIVAAVPPILKEHGQLVAVTFRDDLDDYNTLLRCIGHVARSGTDRYFNIVIDVLESLGNLSVSRVSSSIHAQSLRELVDILSFVATNSNAGTLEGRAEVRDGMAAISDTLTSRYQRPDKTYRFPMHHYVMVVRT